MRAVHLASLVAWPAAAAVRIATAHDELKTAKGLQHSQFFASASLDLTRSVGPVLVRPWRPDIRLYYAHFPRFSRNFCDAHAVREPSGAWSFKIHR